MGRRGIALVAALWGLLLAGTIALSFSFAMRTEAQGALNGAEAAQAYYRARTGVARAAALLAVLPPEELLRREIGESDGEGGYEVSVEDASGRIDVNRTAVEEIRDALGRSGFDAGEAERVAAAILDWRSAPEERAGGSEALDAAYAALPEPVSPRHGAILTLDELRSLPGVSPEMYRRAIEPVFTAHGASPQVNANAAPPAVLLAVGLSPAQAGVVVQERRDEPFRNASRLGSLLAREGVPPEVARRLSVGPFARVFTVTARGRAGAAERTIRATFASAGPQAGAAPRPVRWEDLATPEASP